ncbi:metalloregulator ArsR/SmtB family transcription factor [Streptomyces sp. NPDC049949]|uniref:ArsR/SmtB family transcription factor n=1 Tax=Streptomyces sp. NPDC049949 TaxID=3154627 RepID=UPI0034376B85
MPGGLHRRVDLGGRSWLLHALASEEADVATLVAVVGAARPAVSRHLARLRMPGLVTTRKEGRHMVYAQTDDHLRRLVAEALAAAWPDRPGHGRV